MKTFLLTLSMALAGLSLGLAPLDADARRFGGGGSVGMQRQAPPPRPAEATPARPAQHNGSTATNPAPSSGGAAAAGQRSWMGPIAGLAAGLGLAALASYLGFGETLAHAMTLVLIALLAFVLVRWLLRRSMPQPTQGGLQYAGATAAGRATPSWAGAQGATAGVGSSAAPAAAPAVTGASPWPADFDRAGFERIAKMLFIRMQAAHDAGEVEDLRKFTTPELFAAVQLDLHERRGAPQRTDVLQLDAQVVDVAQEEGQQVVSVRFHGLIREAADAAAEPFDELWHFVKPLDGHREWAIAGITQNTTPPALH
ncbi:MAG: Tim44-like domain-containing protein [Caldimonas manganoxidans]|nr:Tim44-like domain-containing protein [Caldimonas manganoxidans]